MELKSLDLSVVVPVYREEQNIPVFVERIQKILSRISENYEVIFALDPSPDRSEEVIEELHAKDSRIKLLKFSRRFGQPMATLAGLSHSVGESVVVMDVDLQDPPELILEMYQQRQNGFEVVYAQRKNRTGEPWIKKLVASLGYKLINRIAEVNIPPNTGDFRMMSRRVVEHVISLKESHGFLRGAVALVGFPTTYVQFERPARFAGETNYNRFLGSIRIGMNGVVCFSNDLLALSTLTGFFFSMLSLLLAVFWIGAALVGAHLPIGNPTILILVLFMGGVQLISIGILGEYIGRIYDEVKQRPKFIVDRSLGVNLKSVTQG